MCGVVRCAANKQGPMIPYTRAVPVCKEALTKPWLEGALWRVYTT